MGRNIFIKNILTLVFITSTLTMVAQNKTAMQAGNQVKREEWMIRIAKIEVDSAYLPQYKAAIEEHTKAAIASDPGVLTLYAVYEKEHPTRVMVFEIYASKEAYQSHIKTPHFLKYKNGTLNMVKSLELIDVDPIALGVKPDFLKNDKK